MTRNRSINKNLKRKATPVGAFTAGLPVAKLNSFGRVSVGLTTCEYKIYIEVTLEIIVLLYNPLTATGGFTGGQFLITGWDFMRLLLVGLVKREETWTNKRVNCRDAIKGVVVPLLIWLLRPSSAYISSSPEKATHDLRYSRHSPHIRSSGHRGGGRLGQTPRHLGHRSIG